MDDKDDVETEIEELRKRLLGEAYAMAFSGMSAAILDVGEIERADADELLEIARRSGVK
jgi:hypothetical protein